MRKSLPEHDPNDAQQQRQQQQKKITVINLLLQLQFISLSL